LAHRANVLRALRSVGGFSGLLQRPDAFNDHLARFTNEGATARPRPFHSPPGISRQSTLP